MRPPRSTLIPPAGSNAAAASGSTVITKQITSLSPELASVIRSPPL